MSEGPVPTVTRDPASKRAVAVEVGSIGAVIGAFAPMLVEWGTPPATTVFASSVFAVIVGVAVSYWRDRQFNKKGV